MSDKPFRLQPWPNQRKAAKRQRDEAIMNEIEYYKLQLKLGWSNAQAAEFFDVNITTIRRWRSAKIPTPKAVILCLKSVLTAKPVGNIL